MADSFDWTSLIGPLLGGYAGYRAGGPQTQTTSTQMDPDMKNQWLAYRDFANQVANRPYTPGVAPFSQDQYQSMDQVRNLSGGGMEQQAGSAALQGFLGGGAQNPYMNSNPYLAGIMQTTGDQIQNRMNTSAFSSGSFGNSGIGYSGAKALADSANQLQYGDYQNQANLAENALNRTASMIPQALGYQNQGLTNASALMQSGAMQQNLGQNYLTDYLNYPAKQLGYMGQPLGFNMGQTTTQQIPGNTWASALGGGLLGYQLGNAFTPTTPPTR